MKKNSVSEPILSLKDLEKFDSYLTSRLGCKLRFEVDRSSDDHVTLMSQEFEWTQVFGIFKHIIDKMQVYVNLWKTTKDGEIVWQGIVSFQYEHINNSGSNGHDTTISLNYCPKIGHLWED